jgi:hypothetical protein
MTLLAQFVAKVRAGRDLLAEVACRRQATNLRAAVIAAIDERFATLVKATVELLRRHAPFRAPLDTAVDAHRTYGALSLALHALRTHGPLDLTFHPLWPRLSFDGPRRALAFHAHGSAFRAHFTLHRALRCPRLALLAHLALRRLALHFLVLPATAAARLLAVGMLLRTVITLRPGRGRRCECHRSGTCDQHHLAGHKDLQFLFIQLPVRTQMIAKSGLALPEPAQKHGSIQRVAGSIRR